MAALSQNETTVNQIHTRVLDIVGKGGDDRALLLLFSDMKNELEKLFASSTEVTLSLYCQKYEGFYQLMKTLQRVAQGISTEDHSGSKDA
jgi:hypothetical protein